jgi:hypothetical protein
MSWWTIALVTWRAVALMPWRPVYGQPRRTAALLPRRAPTLEARRPSAGWAVATVAERNGDADNYPAGGHQQGEKAQKLPRILSRTGLPERSFLSRSEKAHESLLFQHRPQ